jgi:hypothetical protein
VVGGDLLLFLSPTPAPDPTSLSAFHLTCPCGWWHWQPVSFAGRRLLRVEITLRKITAARAGLKVGRILKKIAVSVGSKFTIQISF